VCRYPNPTEYYSWVPNKLDVPTHTAPPLVSSFLSSVFQGLFQAVQKPFSIIPCSYCTYSAVGALLEDVLEGVWARAAAGGHVRR
jgi:hypothetical protein